MGVLPKCPDGGMLANRKLVLESGRAQPHSTTLPRSSEAFYEYRQVLECGCALPLSNALRRKLDLGNTPYGGSNSLLLPSIVSQPR
jgi:hypothetical protein